MYENIPLEAASIHSTAEVAYSGQGAGIGAGEDAIRLLKTATDRVLVSGDVVLEVGFGHGEVLRKCTGLGIKSFGVDISEQAFNIVSEWALSSGALCTPFLLDISHQRIPVQDDIATLAFCTETIEHVANPYHLVAEVKRVLKHGGLFVLSFPRPEDNLGYGGGQHAHVYPGFLLQESFERFMKQLYFRKVHHSVNGASSWYVYENYKGIGVIDVFQVVSGNYEEQKLYDVVAE